VIDMTHIEVELSFPFDTPANYTYDALKIEVISSVAQLIGDPVIPHAHWKMNETSPSSTVADTSPNAFTGTVTGDQTFVAGKLNNAKYFDGNTFVTFGNVFTWDRTQPFSIEFWLKTTDDSGYIIQQFSSPGGQLKGIAAIIFGGRLRFSIFGNNANRISLEVDQLINDDTWYHVIYTYDGSSTAAGAHIYIDLVEPTRNVINDNLNASIANTVDTVIGSYGGSNYADLLDEIVIYQRALSSAERTFRYNAGAGTELLYEGYPIDSPTIENITSKLFEGNIEAFEETATKSTNTEVKYQISADNGNTWQYWNGEAWTTITAGQTDEYYYTNESSLASVINTNIGTWTSSGNFKFRAFLNSSDSYNTPELDALTVTYAKEEEISVYKMVSKFGD
jgi:hypothetical protein